MVNWMFLSKESNCFILSMPPTLARTKVSPTILITIVYVSIMGKWLVRCCLIVLDGDSSSGWRSHKQWYLQPNVLVVLRGKWLFRYELMNDDYCDLATPTCNSLIQRARQLWMVAMTRACAITLYGRYFQFRFPKGDYQQSMSLSWYNP